jgi:hypothetical protein
MIMPSAVVRSAFRSIAVTQRTLAPSTDGLVATDGRRVIKKALRKPLQTSMFISFDIQERDSASSLWLVAR